MNILIVNDIVLEANTIQSEINWSDLGIAESFTAYSADDARNIIEHNTIDILLSDIEMPGENGISLISWIKNEQLDVDCILLTCHADFSYARDGLSLGCQEYILMPASYETIAAAVQKTVAMRSMRLEEKKLSSYGKTWLQSQADSIDVHETQHKKTSAETAEDCERIIREKLSDEELSVAGIAADLFLNPISLNRIYKKERGINLSQYITKERMELAGLLMRTTNHSAVDIALQCGYPNYPYFTTVFKKYYDRTPSQYMEECK